MGSIARYSLPPETIHHARPSFHLCSLLLLAFAMVAASTLYALAQQAPTLSRVRGTIEGVDGDLVAVKSRGGEDVKLHMTADAKVVGITKISLADIKVGSFIGTTTVAGPDGSRKPSRCMFSGRHARHRRGLAAI